MLVQEHSVKEENLIKHTHEINIPDDEFGGTLNILVRIYVEKNTDSYNESSISFGQENEDYGLISREDVGRGFGFNVLGIGLSSVDSLDASNLTFDSSTSDQTYDGAVGGAGVLPSFDKSTQHQLCLHIFTKSKDYGSIDSVLLVVDLTLRTDHLMLDSINRGINKGYIDQGWIGRRVHQP